MEYAKLVNVGSKKIERKFCKKKNIFAINMKYIRLPKAHNKAAKNQARRPEHKIEEYIILSGSYDGPDSCFQNREELCL